MVNCYTRFVNLFCLPTERVVHLAYRLPPHLPELSITYRIFNHKKFTSENHCPQFDFIAIFNRAALLTKMTYNTQKLHSMHRPLN